MKKNIGIQGIKGSFHHQVSVNYFSEPIDIIPLLSFSDVVKRLCSGEAEIGVIALENSIAGSIIPNYALIDSNSLHITGEYYLEVEHHLMALNGQTIEDIKEVCSHPMALLQCQLFFAVLFTICFSIILFMAYKKDAKLHKKYYKGSAWVLLAFIAFIGLIATIKFIFV